MEEEAEDEEESEGDDRHSTRAARKHDSALNSGRRMRSHLEKKLEADAIQAMGAVKEEGMRPRPGLNGRVAWNHWVWSTTTSKRLQKVAFTLESKSEHASFMSDG